MILPEVDTSETVSVTFQPRRDNGLVLMVTDVNASESVLAVGMFNGEVNQIDIQCISSCHAISLPFQLRLSNFSSDSMLLLPSVCEPANPTFYTISLTYTQGSVEVVAQGMNGVRFPISARDETLLLTIGNTPRMSI